MVYLNRIYTKAGDDGRTSLGSGERVHKTHPRIVSYGAVDELNAAIGVLLLTDLPSPLDEWLRSIQNDLFDIGADLCVPEPESPPDHPPLRVATSQVERLERWIDELNDPLPPLTSFVLPGGTPPAAHLHVARTVCRRAEIAVWKLAESEHVNPEVMRYLNRLSDLLFVAGRVCNDVGRSDVLWVPGQSRGDV